MVAKGTSTSRESAFRPPEKGAHNIARERSIEVSLSRPLSLNGAYPMIPPSEFTKVDLYPPSEATGTILPHGPPLRKKVSFGESLVQVIHPDMKYDDDEFAYAAHLILARIKGKNNTIKASQDVVSALQDTVDVIWRITSGEEYETSEELMIPRITRQLISDFDAALKYRMKYVSFRPSSTEDVLEKLTREAAMAIASRGYPVPDDHEELTGETGIHQETRTSPNKTNDTRKESRDDIGLFERMRQYFLPDADTSISSGSSVPDKRDGREPDPGVPKWCHIREEEYADIDRTYEEDIVVFREYKSRFIDLSALQASVTRSSGDRSTRIQQARDDAMITRELSLSRQKLIEEAKRVTNMLETTTNENVKNACRSRLVYLRLRIQELTQEKGLPVNSRCTEEQSSMESNAMRVEDQWQSTDEKDGEIDVEAPADLPGNYRFEAKYGGSTFTASVPPRGVKRGEIFQSSLGPVEFGNPGSVRGRWKDGIFACCRRGPLDPLLLNALFCPLLAIAQVMTRMDLNWVGLPGVSRKSPAFQIALLMSMSIAVINCLIYYLPRNAWTGQLSVLQIALFASFNVSVGIYYIANVVRARRHARRLHMIGGGFFGELIKDVLLSTVLSSCVVTQIGRQSGDQHAPGRCCTKNGLPAHIRPDVPPRSHGSATGSSPTTPLRVSL